ncbi:hypothetical protein [Bacillus mycoides]|uniref:VOC domain-containing protein n=1 Tax=Bacillus mycoides TaxID=1405 RepID=A0ABC9R472_BACMY|nr:hypothetical protein III_02312 [Bacillus mycoides]
MKIHRIDHVGIIVNDLPAAKAFFLDIGFEMLGEGKNEKFVFFIAPKFIFIVLEKNVFLNLIAMCNYPYINIYIIFHNSPSSNSNILNTFHH